MIPSALKDTWEEVEKQIDAGENDAALETLRAAWAEHGDTANHANTWKLVGDAKQALGESSQPINRKMLRDAGKAYQSALQKDAKHRDARRASNALRAKMDGLGIRSSPLPKLIDDGTPTIYGMISILVVGMLLLTSIKFMPEIKQALGLVQESTDDWDATLAIELYPSAAPKTIDSFKDHAHNGRYEGIAFHRVIDGFMVQGGDPTGTGSGGPGYMFEDEVNNGLKFDKPGLLAMANAGPGTNGSQFFITHVPTPHLTGNHTIFGEVIEGMDTVFAIPERNPQNTKDSGVIMSKVTINTD